jgi:hypothetical protein
MAKKKKPASRARAALFFPDHLVYERVDLLAKLIQAELPIRMRVPGHVAVAQAIEEAIKHREKADGKSQP